MCLTFMSGRYRSCSPNGGWKGVSRRLTHGTVVKVKYAPPSNCGKDIELLLEVEQSPPVTKAKRSIYMDDAVVVLSPEHDPDMRTVTEVTQWPRDHLQTEGAALKH